MKDQIKVLMVVPNLRVSNGVASFAISYYRTIDHSVVKMDFVCYKNIESPYVKEIEEHGDRVFFLPPIKRIINHYKACRRIVREGQYDVIHDNSLMITYPIMIAAKQNINVRILHSHNTKLGDTTKKELRNRAFISFLLRTCNYFSACSSIAGVKLFGQRPFTVLPNVIDPNLFKYNEDVREKKRKEEGCSDKIIIGAVGRLAHQKNPYFAIDVIEHVINNREDVAFWWIGSGGLDDDVKEYVSKKGLTERIRLFGSREDVPELYQAMDLFFLPSKFEGFGLACLEAEAAGLPCIISTGFPNEINVTGDVTQVSLEKNSEEWASIILESLERRIIREEGFRLVNNSIYCDRVSGRKLSAFYFEAINKSCGDRK